MLEFDFDFEREEQHRQIVADTHARPDMKNKGNYDDFKDQAAWDRFWVANARHSEWVRQTNRSSLQHNVRDQFKKTINES